MGVLTEVTLADLTLLQQAIPVRRKLGVESRYSIGPLDDGDVEPVDLVVLRQESEGADGKRGKGGSALDVARILGIKQERS